jgi:hypothetical protein
MLNVQEIFKTSMLGIQTDQSEPGCSDQLVLVHLQGASHVVQQNKFNGAPGVCRQWKNYKNGSGVMIDDNPKLKVVTNSS